jgi:DNA-directed RNA polymerase subunit M/transcription elongation factor TFIIS
MLNRTLKVLVILSLILVYSCTNKESKKEVNQEKETVEKTDEVLKLNDSKLWAANKETTDGVNNMIAKMNSFTEKENLASYAQLKENLTSEFTTIFQKCTMKGEAHNQLHNFLIPIKDILPELSSNNIDTCKDAFTRLNTHLKVYKNYFV